VVEVSIHSNYIVCAGQKSGSKAAIHPMHTVFEADYTDAQLFIDASNAFNALTCNTCRASAPHNIQVLCPLIAVYAISTPTSSTFPNAKKCWITSKPDKEANVKRYSRT